MKSIHLSNAEDSLRWSEKDQKKETIDRLFAVNKINIGNLFYVISASVNGSQLARLEEELKGRIERVYVGPKTNNWRYAITENEHRLQFFVFKRIE